MVPDKLGTSLIRNESVIVPGVIVDEHPDVGLVTASIEIFVVPALVKADDNTTKEPKPDVMFTPVAVPTDVLAPERLYVKS